MTVTVNGRTIETDDAKVIQDAIRESSKAEASERKARQKREKEAAEATKLAESEAFRAAYYILEGKASGRMGHRAYCKPFARYSPVSIIGEFPETVLSIECEGGRVEYQSYSWQYLGCVMSGNGFCMALFLRDKESGETTCEAIGAARIPSDPSGPSAFVFRKCSGITPDDFPPESA